MRPPETTAQCGSCARTFPSSRAITSTRGHLRRGPDAAGVFNELADFVTELLQLGDREETSSGASPLSSSWPPSLEPTEQARRLLLSGPAAALRLERIHSYWSRSARRSSSWWSRIFSTRTTGRPHCSSPTGSPRPQARAGRGLNVSLLFARSSVPLADFHAPGGASGLWQEVSELVRASA